MADIQKYINLVTSEHANKPNFIAWLTAYLNIIDDAAALLNNLYTYFDLDNAVGTQLDTVGNIAGVSRTVNFQPSDGSSPVLDDAVFLMCIKAKIAMNQWDGTIPTVYALWAELFPRQLLILTDNQDMSMNALCYGFTTGIQQDLVANGYIIPKPQGVRLNYAFPAHPVFSYGLDNDAFAGYGTGYWVEYF